VIVDLPAPFQVALQVIVGELTTRGDVVGILFFGSAARGEARTGSDLDLYAITSQDARGHLGRSMAGVPVEVSFGSIAQMTAQVQQELPTVVHAFATGHLLLDCTDGALLVLCQEARTIWERGPSPLPASARLRFQFHLTDLVRDIEGMPENSAATALAGSECVRLALEAFCGTKKLWMPPMRTILATLDAQHPDVTALVRRCADAGFPGSLAVKVADRVLQDLGGRLAAYDTAPQ
jgi:hypothetical protein